MQAGVDKWEAAGFLGISVEMLDRVYGHHVYGHHHPLHLRQAANAIGYRRQKEPLSVSLSKPKPASFNATQVVDIAGGARSDYPTSLASEMGKIMGKSLKSLHFEPRNPESLCATGVFEDSEAKK